jgi:hypothetical protein
MQNDFNTIVESSWSFDHGYENQYNTQGVALHPATTTATGIRKKTNYSFTDNQKQ